MQPNPNYGIRLQRYGKWFGLTRIKGSNLGRKPTKVPKSVQSTKITALSDAQNCIWACPYPLAIRQTCWPDWCTFATIRMGTFASAPSAMVPSWADAPTCRSRFPECTIPFYFLLLVLQLLRSDQLSWSRTTRDAHILRHLSSMLASEYARLAMFFLP